MKKVIIILLAGTLSAVSFTALSQDETAAIKAVIEKETSAFFNVNRKEWEDVWLHVPYAYWSYSDSTGTNFLEGWDAINKSFDDYFKTQVSARHIDAAKQSGVTIERTWKEIRIYGNGAFVQYTQEVKDSKIDYDKTSQIRILEKKGGKWKVVSVNVIAKYPKE